MDAWLPKGAGRGDVGSLSDLTTCASALRKGAKMFAAADSLGSEDSSLAFHGDLEKLVLATAETMTLLVAERRSHAG
jgi:hypothetical protein